MVGAELVVEVEVKSVQEEANVEGAGVANDELMEGGLAAIVIVVIATAGDEIEGEGAGANVLAARVADVLTVHHGPLIAP